MIIFKLKSKTIADYSEQFQVGIFQAIGFKEFNEYLNGKVEEEVNVAKMFEKGVEEMKAVTRKYARKQQRWIYNRLVKSIF